MCIDCIVCCRLEVDHSLYDDLRGQYPDHLPLFKARLEALDNHKVQKQWELLPNSGRIFTLVFREIKWCYKSSYNRFEH